MAALRSQPDHLKKLWPGARILPFWRGKPLVVDGNRLGFVGAGHPAVSGMGPESALFLGLANDQGWFACNLSAWVPSDIDAGAEAAFFDPTEQHHPDFPPDHRFVELRGCMAQLSALDAELAASARALFQWHDSHGHCARCGHASDLTAGGWQRKCPACAAPHFPRTDPVVIMLITRGNSVLVGRSAVWPARMYSLLAGFIEPGETIEAAVRREVFEETGVRVGPVQYLASQPWPFPASLMLGLAGDALSTEITLDPVELEDAIWVTREDMAAALAGRHPTIDPARHGSIARYLIERWVAGV